MLVRTFTAEDMPAALQKVKQTLGPDALILSTRTLRKKGLGMLGRALIEVTAAIESPAMAEPKRTPERKAPQPAKSRAAAAYREAEKAQKEPPRPARPVVEPLEMELNQLRRTVAEQNVGELQRDLEELKQMVQSLAESRLSASPEPLPATDLSPAVATPPMMPAPVTPVTPRPRPAPATSPLLATLHECGIEREAAETIARFADSRMSAAQREDAQQRHEFLRDTIADLIQFRPPIWDSAEPEQRRIALIGPTGVGKTTTIAKLAAAALAAGKRVALVTIDTFRIAAVEQLKVYGEIMGLPVEVIFRPAQLGEALALHRDKDLILIDTAGRSPRDHEQIEELQDFLGADSGIENWLVLAAHTREEQLRQVVERFVAVPLKSLVFTKLDECVNWGVLLNLPTRTSLPLACLTNGQQVPEDLLAAEPRLVADWILGSEPQVQKDVV